MIRLVAMTPEALPRALQGQTAEWNPSLEPLLETGPAFVMDIRQDPRTPTAMVATRPTDLHPERTIQPRAARESVARQWSASAGSASGADHGRAAVGHVAQAD